MPKDSAAHFYTLLLEDNWTEHGKAAIQREMTRRRDQSSDWTLARNAWHREKSYGAGSTVPVLVNKRRRIFPAGERGISSTNSTARIFL